MQKNLSWRPALLVAVVGMAAALSSCNRTRISDIHKDPASYAGYEVTVAGKVTHSGADFRSGSFEIDDGSGKLWVISRSLNLPSEGTQIAVTGMVEGKTDLGSTTLLTVLQETRRYGGGD